MANEARVSVGISIRKGFLDYRPPSEVYLSDVSVGRGPTPGTIAVPVTGVDVDLSALTNPGLCKMKNLDPTNYVEWGIHDGSIFHPVGRMLPGEPCVFRISADLGLEEAVPGTGTTNPPNTLFLRANGATCQVNVEAFDS